MNMVGSSHWLPRRFSGWRPMGVECREDADLNATIHWFGDGASQSAPENDGSRSIPNRRIMEDYGGWWKLGIPWYIRYTPRSPRCLQGDPHGCHWVDVCARWSEATGGAGRPRYPSVGRAGWAPWMLEASWKPWTYTHFFEVFGIHHGLQKQSSWPMVQCEIVASKTARILRI